MFVFGESWDPYATLADALAGYWDGGTGSGFIVAGRFAGSQALSAQSATGSVWFLKNSGANDAVHHISCAFRQTPGLSGTTLGFYFQLSDGATNQVCIVFRSDGVILLTSATPVGTVLATYSGAVTANNTWFQFEFEIIINNATGRFRARKNGNTVDDFDSGAVLNTRPGANAYANRLGISEQATLNAHQVDDLLWRSDASSVAWVGDIRCYTRMPASDASTQFARSPSPATSSIGVFTTSSDGNTTTRYSALSPAFSGTVGTLSVNVNTGFTGNMKCTLFADAAGSPGAILGSATNVVNPASGNNTFTFGTPVAVTKGTQFWLGVAHDVTAVLSVSSGTTGKNSVTVSYAAFPTASPTVSNSAAVACTVNITPTISAEYVNETLQDGTTSYVYDATVGHADLYNLGTLSPPPATVVAVTTRAFMQKSDAGAKSAAVQIKSGGTTVASTSTALSSSFGWLFRTDLVDPATGSAWTNGAVNVVQVGPICVA